MRHPRTAHGRDGLAALPWRAGIGAEVKRVTVFRRFHRHLRAGIRLEVLVTKRGYVGKYTRFRIRRNAPPYRVDCSLSPKTERAMRCSS